MKQLMLKWLTNLLDPWFVTLEDYKLVQSLRWSADYEIRRLLSEQQELLNSIYDRKYRNFELLDEQVFVKKDSFEDVQLDAIRFRWEVGVAARKFYTTWSATKELEVVENDVVTKLAENFKKLIRKQLFKPDAKLSS